MSLSIQILSTNTTKLYEEKSLITFSSGKVVRVEVCFLNSDSSLRVLPNTTDGREAMRLIIIKLISNYNSYQMSSFTGICKILVHLKKKTDISSSGVWTKLNYKSSRGERVYQTSHLATSPSSHSKELLSC